MTPSVGAAIKQTAVTNASGIAVFDLSSVIAAATPAVGGYGPWTFVASFDGVTQ
jgi:hypothetical protein